MRQSLLALLALVGSLNGTAADTSMIGQQAPDQAKATKTLALTYDPLMCPLPVVHLSINGSPPIAFILSTSTPNTITLEPWAAKEAGIDLAGLGDQNPVPGNPAYVVQLKSVAATDSLTAQPIKLPAYQALIQDLGMEGAGGRTRVGGVINPRQFGASPIRFDFRAKRLQILSADAPLDHSPTASVITMKDDGALQIPVTFDGLSEPLSFVVDTAAAATIIRKEELDRVKPLATSDISYGARIGWKIEDVKAVWLPNLTVGRFVVAGADALATRSKTAKLQLGMNVLSRFEVTYDRTRKTLILDKMVPADEVPVDARASVILELKEGKALVAWVEKNSTAEKAGLRRGMVVHEIDGANLNGFGIIAAQYMLMGYAGDTAEVVVAGKAGAEQRMSYVREPKFKNMKAPTIGVGLSVGQLPSGRWIIAEVDSGTPVAENGLKAHDEITSVNGVPAPGLTPEAFGAQMKKKLGETITLKIKRETEADERTVILKVRKL